MRLRIVQNDAQLYVLETADLEDTWRPVLADECIDRIIDVKTRLEREGDEQERIKKEGEDS